MDGVLDNVGRLVVDPYNMRNVREGRRGAGEGRRGRWGWDLH